MLICISSKLFFLNLVLTFCGHLSRKLKSTNFMKTFNENTLSAVSVLVRSKLALLTKGDGKSIVSDLDIYPIHPYLKLASFESMKLKYVYL